MDGFLQTNLNRLWHYSTGCSGGGGKTTAYANGYVYTRDFNGNLVLDAANGMLVSTYATTRIPAVDRDSMFTLSGQTLAARGLTGAPTRWTFTGDGQLITAPIVITTTFGEFVVEGSSSGKLYALDASSGAEVWSTNVGAAIPGADEQNANLLTGLAAGQGLLVVPAGNTLSAYTGRTTYPNDTTPPTITVPRISRPRRQAPRARRSRTPRPRPTRTIRPRSSLTCAPASGSTFALRTTTVTCNAHDPAGNNAVPASFHVTIRDTTAPVISTTANLTVNATSPSGATVTYAVPQATDLVDGNVLVTCSPESGTPFANGTTTVKCTATDAHDNSAASSFTVAVLSAPHSWPRCSAVEHRRAAGPEPEVLDKLKRRPRSGGAAESVKACAGLAKFSTDVQANTTPRGPITSAHSDSWIAAANGIRTARAADRTY